MPPSISIRVACAVAVRAMVAVSLVGATTSFAGPAAESSTAAAKAAGIAWRKVANEADVDAAFSDAKATGKPLLLYWGAVWCPPCNQVQATVFNRADFVERTRAFVPVYVDGDRPGAQKLGARFHVSGYPTLVLFAPSGVEMTRLPGEVEPARYLEVMTLGLEARRSAKAVLSAALGAAPDLTPAEWRLLAFYAWDTDEQQLVPTGELPGVLRRLADRCPPAEHDAGTRLWLKALAARSAKPEAGRPPAAHASSRERASDRERLLALLRDPSEVRRHVDVLENEAVAIVQSLGGARTEGLLVRAFDDALHRLQGDATLSRADRLGALDARVALARAVGGPVPAPLQAEVRRTASEADLEITDGYERQAVIPSAAQLLDDAGLATDARRLLESNLAKSHSPYYLMTALAEIEAHHGAKAAALRWHREAWQASVGPATRLQWGARYVRALTQLAPTDDAAVQGAALHVVDEAAAQPDAFYERSARSLRRVGSVMREWNGNGRHAEAWRRFAARVGEVCARYPAGEAQRSSCDAVLSAKPSA